MSSLYPLEPGARGTDTSAEAAAAMAPRQGKLQQLVLGAIRASGPRGLTAHEAAFLLDIDRAAIQPRTTELRLAGLVRDSGARRLNASGRRAIVWVAAGGAA